MKDATKEEIESVANYINSISTKNGVNFNEEFAIDGGDMYESIVLKDKKINGLPTDRLKNFAKYMKDNDNGLGMESVR